MSFSAPSSQFLGSLGISILAAADAGLKNITELELYIPYLDLKGDTILDPTGAPLNRTYTIMSAGAAFWQPPRPSPDHPPYLPFGLKALLDEIPSFLVITVGELKALAATSNSIACLALASANAWRAAPTSNIVNEQIVRLSKSVGRVVVLGDSDTFNNADLAYPLTCLSNELRKQSDALVAFVSVPDSKTRTKGTRQKKNGEQLLAPDKIGLGEWIVRHKDDLSYVTEFLQKRLDQEDGRQTALHTGGYIPLGYSSTGSHVWSVPRNAVYDLNAGAITSAGTLMTVAGNKWLESRFGTLDRNGIIQLDCRSIGGQIIDECAQKGAFSESKVRGTGVWLADDDNGVLIVNNGSDIWRTDGRPQHRMDGKHIYSAYSEIGLRCDHPQAEPAEVQEILDALKTWHFKRNSDAYLLLGWIAAAGLTAAWKWRSHAAITSLGGHGKSTLMQFISSLLGNAAVSIDADTTEPGMRQKLARDSRAVIVDEAEGDTSRITKLMRYFRTASSGGEILMGTQTHNSTGFTVRCAALISAVNLPKMSPTDAGRYVVFNLVSEPNNKGAEPEIVEEENKLAGPAGLKLMSRMVHAWPRVTSAQKLLKTTLSRGATLRYADTLSPILASAWCALNDGILMADEAAGLIAGIDLSDATRQIEEQQADTSILDHALDSMIAIDVDGKSTRMTVRMALELFANNGDKQIGRAIGAYGFKLVRDGESHRLLVNEKTTEFRKFYRETKWANIDFETALKRIPGASQKRYHVTTYIGGSPIKPLSLPIELDCQAPTGILGSIQTKT